MAEVTVVIAPRDRYSGVLDCIKNLYEFTPESFDLLVLDLDYPVSIMKPVKDYLQTKGNAKVVSLGLVIPMEAFRKIRNDIPTPFTVFLDNDSDVTKGWLQPLLETAKSTGAGFVSPLTLEAEGVDEGAGLRNHLYTSDIRVVEVDGIPRLIEHKHFRRALPETIPQETASTETFELHCVLFNTKVLQEIDLPQMVIREHIDIGIQLQARGIPMVAEPQSVITFDNLGTPMTLKDMKYFWFRWHPKLTKASSRLFEKRWGFNFYSEQSMYNWVKRRKLFLLGRWLGLSISLCNRLGAIYYKFFLKHWDPLKDPIGDSKRFFDTCHDGKPIQKDHAINFV